MPPEGTRFDRTLLSRLLLSFIPGGNVLCPRDSLGGRISHTER